MGFAPPLLVPVATHSKATVFPCVNVRFTPTLKSEYRARVCFTSATMASRPAVSGKPGWTIFPFGSNIAPTAAASCAL